MNLALALLLGATAPSASPVPPDLTFRSGQLTHWEGNGFSVGPAVGHGPTLNLGVCSSDNGARGRTALLHRTFTVPDNAIALRFTAAAVRPKGAEPGATLDVVLEAPGREFIPRQLLTPAGEQPAPDLLPMRNRRPREYSWSLVGYAGRRVRIALIDKDARPGCYVVCGGFRLVTGQPRLASDDPNIRSFGTHMDGLRRTHRLATMAKQESAHFLAIGNAAPDYTRYRLSNCETIYSVFFDHFRRRGFTVREPVGKMMVAIFDSQKGFDAYLGTKGSWAVGIYHPASNRLVVYDYGTNKNFVEGKKRTDEMLNRSGLSHAERSRLTGAVGWHYEDHRANANVSTIMHEVAHQLSFNGGMLNRQGSVPVWLAEGLACYCESTVNGGWQGIGEPNPRRAQALAGPARGRGAFIPLRELVSSDDWLRKAPNEAQIALGYAQSWALFRFLMKERRAELRRYLEMIYPRQTPDHRLTDFAECFGADLARLEQRYRASMREVVRNQVR